MYEYLTLNDVNFNVMHNFSDVLILCTECFLQVLGTDDLNAYLNKYCLELDPHLEALVGRFV